MSMKEVSRQIAELSSQFKKLDKKFDEGFNASKVRDEELMGLMKFGLEAREALRESVDSRFDEADRKHNEQIGLLKDVARHLSSPK